MKKKRNVDFKIVLIGILSIIVLTLSGFFFVENKNIKSISAQNEIKDQQISKLKNDNKVLNTNNTSLEKKYDQAQKTIRNTTVVENNNPESKNYKSFSDTTYKTFTGLYNFKPKSYKNRKDILKPLISDKLYNRYFSNEAYYGDSNGTTSEVISIDVYNKTIQDNTLNGLVVVKYQSKSGDNDFKKSTDLYQISYDVLSNKVTEITSLGTGIQGDNIE
ncbi:hypothetical protein P7D73_18210 [Enterococcus raffinosus]|uniref:hypothetical protein n=1 Tax=Enterococcus raffinosus TaxID=71452 RepID=UPI00288F80CD|nr:hypothetical protein [Enterococcus raffinosus]MDT2525141.1 hypothetical protein [Enterococcus raffinosus]MDT2592496.1 hypothetical protein [Enterococcus raffinosus]